MARLFECILDQDDPRAYVYEGLCGAYGVDVQTILTDLFNDISADEKQYPDVDFDKIINYMIEYMENA